MSKALKGKHTHTKMLLAVTLEYGNIRVFFFPFIYSFSFSPVNMLYFFNLKEVDNNNDMR